MINMVATTGARSRAKLQSNRHHQQTNAQFFTGRIPSCSPTNSVGALKRNYSRLIYCLVVMTACVECEGEVALGAREVARLQARGAASRRLQPRGPGLVPRPAPRLAVLPSRAASPPAPALLPARPPGLALPLPPLPVVLPVARPPRPVRAPGIRQPKVPPVPPARPPPRRGNVVPTATRCLSRLSWPTGSSPRSENTRLGCWK